MNILLCTNQPATTMLKRFVLFSFALLLSSTLIACDSGDDDDGGGGGSGGPCDSGSVTATVDGSSFAAECVTLDVANGILTFSGIANADGSSGSDQETITLGGIQAQVGTQTPAAATYARAPNADPSDVTTCVAAGTATATISEIDSDNASGTFSFTATCFSDGVQTQVAVTNGRFDLSD